MKHIKEYKKYLNDNFWEWFGNSKIVDSDNNPLVVYHGTTSDFKIFDDTLSAYYFTSNPNYAEYISKFNKRNKKAYNIMPVYLKIENVKYVNFKINYENVDNYLNSFNYLSELPDGLIGKDIGTDIDVYVVFKQNQIKSAIGNNGNYSNNNNINENENENEN